MNTELRIAAEAAAAKVAAPVAVVIASIGGVSIAEWLALTTIAYVILQSAVLIWRWRKEWLASRKQ